MRQSARGQRRERGAATVLVVAMAGVLMFVMIGLSAAGGLVTAQRRAQAAADLAALAGASALDDACAGAREIALANAAALESCRVDGGEVTVEVSVAGPRVPWRDVRVTRRGARRSRVTSRAVREGDSTVMECPSATADPRVVRLPALSGASGEFDGHGMPLSHRRPARRTSARAERCVRGIRRAWNAPQSPLRG